ncbi:unnamed protein product [Heterobilharzia americana]|nr:unnamed protein product [Heterobilharzia americana]
MSSCEDLFQSPSIKLGLCNTSSDLFGDSSSKLIRVKEKQNEKQVGINNVVSLMPDFSSYEKHELVMESDTSHPAGSGLQCQLSSVDQENVIPSDCIPNLVMKTKPHQMASVSSAAFCSTPGPFNACFTPRLPKVHSETAPKTVSGDFLLNALQVTPIHPIFKNQNLSIKSEMETTVSQLNYQPKNTSLQPYHSIHGFVSTDNHNLIQDNLIPVDGINFSESLHQSSCNPYVCLSNERFENWQHYPESPIINKFIQAGKKSGSYTKRITRLFRYENMILNRSYMTLYGAGDVKGTLFKICGQSEYKTFAQLFVPFRRKNLRKIGEGCFGEVFRCLSEYNKSSNDKLDYVVIKLIPIEDNGLVYVDLSCDPTLFQSKGDYQFDIYRFMRSENRNDWKTFTPKTNVMWFHYLTTKLCCNSDLSSVSPPSSTLTFHSTCWKILRDLEACTRSFSYDSAYHLVTSHKLFKDCSKFYTVS